MPEVTGFLHGATAQYHRPTWLTMYSMARPAVMCRNVLLTTMLCKASLLQSVAKLLNGVHKVVGVLTLLEGRSIHKVAVEGAHLAGQGLHQHPNGHSGWEGMRVDDQIRPAMSCTTFQSTHNVKLACEGPGYAN